MTDPAARYRELLDTAHRAARKHTDHERRRLIDLVAEIHATDKEIHAATEAEAQVVGEINGWWRQVVNSVEGQSWLVTTPRPAPDTTARPESLREYLAQIEPATKAFRTALRKAMWPRRP
ncbi:hypothetical protein V5P93_002624 [Actinokineospora auranticolor]|uniref:Uncharacterized protein n=1 Tax=Actinokineospora auranticolor TaxID=155976 RepID=A0A2S6GMF8_9PSEU|nr:hypothetical protein [Actinokineospora auranticolor]PPK66346.1 hypothetical protein CLV40_11050 [Actinokineospora auranticolor]